MVRRTSRCAAALVGGIIVVCFSNRAVSAQGWLSGPGASSLVSASILSVSDDGTEVGAEVAYSHNGSVDAGFGIAQAWLDESDLKGIGFGPQLTLYPVQYTDELPLITDMWASYTRLWYSGDVLDDPNVDLRGNQWSFGGSLRGVIRSEDMRLIPSIGVTHSRSRLTLKAFRQSETSDNNLTSLDAGFTLAFGTEAAAFHIGPGISVTEEGTTFSVSTGVSIPTQRDRRRHATERGSVVIP